MFCATVIQRKGHHTSGIVSDSKKNGSIVGNMC